MHIDEETCVGLSFKLPKRAYRKYDCSKEETMHTDAGYSLRTVVRAKGTHQQATEVSRKSCTLARNALVTQLVKYTRTGDCRMEQLTNIKRS